MDSMDKATSPGFTLIKDSTDVGTKKALSIPLIPYTTNLKRDIIIRDLKSPQGFYPRIILVSGKDIPAKVHEGKVVESSTLIS